jgi:hypothetical protein
MPVYVLQIILEQSDGIYRKEKSRCNENHVVHDFQLRVNLYTHAFSIQFIYFSPQTSQNNDKNYIDGVKGHFYLTYI